MIFLVEEPLSGGQVVGWVFTRSRSSGEIGLELTDIGIAR